MPTPKWLTGRSRTPVFTLDFAIEVEWTPLVDTRVHYVRHGSVFAAVDAAYVTSSSPTIGSGARGPYVSITPEVQVVAGSSTTGASPYKPDSPEGYTWQPPNDPGGGWVEFTAWPLHELQFGWRIVIFGGDGGPTGVNTFVAAGDPVVAWAPGLPLGSNPGPMGGITYSAIGVPPGVTIPSGRARWASPDDWERTGGTTYSHTLSGTIALSGGAREEFFTNLDQPTAINNTSTGVLAGHVSEIGSRNPLDLGPPWARQYAEQRVSGSTQTLALTIGGDSWSVSTAANGTFPNSSFLTPFAQLTAFTHTLGTGGSATSAAYSMSASLAIGGTSVSPVAFSYSDSGGAASQAGGTADSNAVGGSSAWPGFPLFVTGGGQAVRGGIKIGNAASSLKIVIPETVVWNGRVHRLPDQVNDISYDVQIDAYQPSAGVAPTVLQTISGVTNAFSQTFSYDNRAGLGSTRLGSATTHANGSTNWSVNKPSTWPSNAGCRLSGTNATGLPTRRLAIRGRRWTLYRAYAPDVVPIAPDSAGTWPTRTDGPGMTSSIVSGKLRLTATAAAYTRLPITVPMPEYRMHKIRIRSIGSAGQSLRIRRVGALGSPSQHSFDWFATTGADGDWVEVELDPLAAYPGPCHSIGPGIVLQGAPGYYWQLDTGGAGTIEVEWLRAVVRTFATLDCIRRDMMQDYYNLIGTVDGSPYTLALDGTDNLLGLHGGWNITPDATPSASKPWGHALPYNVIVDDAGPFPRSWWEDADNFEYIAGTGLMRGAGTWSTYLSQSAREPGIDPEAVVVPEEPPTLLPAHAVPAQELLERVILYPGCGDVFGYTDGAYGTSTTLHYGLLLGAAVHGLLLGEIEDGADWPDIIALDGSTERARGEALGDEHYALLTPDLRNGVSYSIRLDPEDDTAQRLTIVAADKRVYRTLWLLAILRMLSMAVSATQRVARAWRASGGTLGLEFRMIGSPDTWESATTSLSIPRGGCIAYDQASATQRLWIVYETSGGGIEARYSDDEGGTWSVATTITSSGRCPAACVSPTQVRYSAWVVGGAVKVKGLDSLDNVVCPETTAVASGAANTGLAIVHDGELLHLTYQASGGSQTSVKSSDGGLSWS